MFDRLIKSDTPKLVAMRERDIPRVLHIIEQTDEDDAEAAEEAFARDGLGGMNVLVVSGEVVGVTGHHIDPETQGSAWLSWTYLDRNAQGHGLGTTMLNTLLGRLAAEGIRKIFIDTSDYAENGRPIYAAAHRMYEEFGAAVEMRIPDYFEVGETKIVYTLDNPESPAAINPFDEKPRGLRAVGLDGAPETEDSAQIVWEVGGFGVEGLDDVMATAREGKARFVMIALPSDVSDLARGDLERLGFTREGRLADYYFTNLHQEWWFNRNVI